MNKIDVNGKIMWESADGERFHNPDERPTDRYGWKKIDVDGRTMWESPDGERSV